MFGVGLKGNSRDSFGKLPCVLGGLKGKLKRQFWEAPLCFGWGYIKANSRDSFGKLHCVLGGVKGMCNICLPSGSIHLLKVGNQRLATRYKNKKESSWLPLRIHCATGIHCGTLARDPPAWNSQCRKPPHPTTKQPVSFGCFLRCTRCSAIFRASSPTRAGILTLYT